jgi:hypothetical protein
MFERYTEKARRAIFFARYEASQFGSPYIETEHLLLGILREDKALINAFLHSHASFESIRKQTEERTVVREKVSTSVDLPLSDECKRILGYTLEEADQLSHKFIGTGHLFLGVLREKECLAAQSLSERGISLDRARELVGTRGPEPLGAAPRSVGLPAGYTSRKLLYNIAAETLVLEVRRPGSAHLLPSRLFIRHKDAEAYEPIGNPTEDIFYESPVTCERHPVVLFNSTKWDSGQKGGDWDGVYSFNLNTQELVLCISPEKLQFSEPHGRLSIVELVSLSEDARTVYVNIGIEKTVSGGGVIHYHLAKVDLADQEVRLLSRLLDTRF